MRRVSRLAISQPSQQMKEFPITELQIRNKTPEENGLGMHNLTYYIVTLALSAFVAVVAFIIIH
jgi:hypothetical protein